MIYNNTSNPFAPDEYISINFCTVCASGLKHHVNQWFESQLFFSIFICIISVQNLIPWPSPIVFKMFNKCKKNVICTCFQINNGIKQYFYCIFNLFLTFHPVHICKWSTLFILALIIYKYNMLKVMQFLLFLSFVFFSQKYKFWNLSTYITFWIHFIVYIQFHFSTIDEQFSVKGNYIHRAFQCLMQSRNGKSPSCLNIRTSKIITFM